MTTTAKDYQTPSERTSQERQPKDFFGGVWARTEKDENGVDQKVDPLELMKIDDIGRVRLDFADNWTAIPQVKVADFNAVKGLLEQSFEGRPFVITGFEKDKNGKTVRCIRCRQEDGIDPEGWDAEEDDDGGDDA